MHYNLYLFAERCKRLTHLSIKQIVTLKSRQMLYHCYFSPLAMEIERIVFFNVAIRKFSSKAIKTVELLWGEKPYVTQVLRLVQVFLNRKKINWQIRWNLIYFKLCPHQW